MTQPTTPQNNDRAPYEGLLKAIVSRITVQPFLFIIAIVIALVVIVIVGGNLGSTNFRIITGVIAGLAIIAIFGYYLLEASKVRAGSSKESINAPPKQAQNISATDNSKITDVTQDAADVTNQSVTASGGSHITGVIQRSGPHQQTTPKKKS